MCDVRSIAVFCNESIEFFPGTASKFFLKLLVTIPVTPILLLLLLLLLFRACGTYGKQKRYRQGFYGETVGNRQLGKPGRILEDNNQMDLQEVKCADMD